MKTCIQIAINSINKNSPLIQNNNSFYYRNRIIDSATRIFIEANPSSVFVRTKKDIIECEARAIHYGTKIGTCIGNINFKDSHYYSNVARVKKQIKQLYIDLKIEL